MLNSLTLKRVESMAACRAQPRHTDSSAFMVVERPILMAVASSSRSCDMRALTNSRRVEPPTISTEERSAGESPEVSSASRMGPSRRARSGSAISISCSRVSLQLKSRSSIRHSTLIGASVTPLGLRVFLAFSAAANSFIRALGLAQASRPCLALNSLAMYLAMHSSNARPPRLRSYAALLTASLPVWNDTHDAVKDAWPRSRNMTLVSFSASKRPLADLKMPNARAVAVFSCMRRRQLSPAMLHA
mmetsp:Transcript_5087/g.8533  ORF Transcript_5087/g.8533 Transcript_5087/m.8533 type:complete len:246 (+) Transcript_5087:1186-1923(+)